MKPKQALVLGQAALGLALVCALWSAAQDQARSNALTSFRHYRADWEEAWRKPVEDLATSTLATLLKHPERDPELAEAALSVLRRSLSWYVRAPTVASKIREWLEVRMARGERDGDLLQPAFEILVYAEADDVDSYRNRIAGLAGDRSMEAAALAEAALKLQAEPGTPAADGELARVATSWRALHGVLDGKRMNWLALEQPAVATAEQEATVAVVADLRALLEPYLGKALGVYGETLPDEHMLALLEATAETINHTMPLQQERVRRARQVLAEFAPHYHFEPVVDTACTTALRYHALPAGGLLIVVAVVGSLVAGLWFALTRLVRGPMPVDVNAETMENVEPIDLDTDAETKSRSSASITDVG
jgi:hypothetical protein